MLRHYYCTLIIHYYRVFINEKSFAIDIATQSFLSEINSAVLNLPEVSPLKHPALVPG